MRPVGALLFGAMGQGCDMGRRPTLMVNVVSFSVFEFASAFAPTLHKSFLTCRALFGIAMGGEWGVGAALALETLPARGRGFFSGLLAGKARCRRQPAGCCGLWPALPTCTAPA